MLKFKKKQIPIQKNLKLTQELRIRGLKSINNSKS